MFFLIEGVLFLCTAKGNVAKFMSNACGYFRSRLIRQAQTFEVYIKTSQVYAGICVLKSNIARFMLLFYCRQIFNNIP